MSKAYAARLSEKSAKPLKICPNAGKNCGGARPDLFMFQDHDFFARFMSVYQSKRPGYTPDETAMEFYKKRRKLEDIYEFTEQLCFEEMAETARAEALSCPASELQSL